MGFGGEQRGPDPAGMAEMIGRYHHVGEVIAAGIVGDHVREAKAAHDLAGAVRTWNACRSTGNEAHILSALAAYDRAVTRTDL